MALFLQVGFQGFDCGFAVCIEGGGSLAGLQAEAVAVGGELRGHVAGIVRGLELGQLFLADFSPGSQLRGGVGQLAGDLIQIKGSAAGISVTITGGEAT